MKLRTLPPTAPPYASKYEIQDLPVPWFPALLRRLHLDELPQLFLVPIGQMSLVGPRPEMGVLHDQVDSAFATRRTRVRPGCTGLWQISDKVGLAIREATEFDDYYLRHWSIRLDTWVLVRTVRLLVAGGRPITLADVPRCAGREGALAPAAPLTLVSTADPEYL